MHDTRPPGTNQNTEVMGDHPARRKRSRLYLEFEAPLRFKARPIAAPKLVVRPVCSGSLLGGNIWHNPTKSCLRWAPSLGIS